MERSSKEDVEDVAGWSMMHGRPVMMNTTPIPSNKRTRHQTRATSSCAFCVLRRNNSRGDDHIPCWISLFGGIPCPQDSGKEKDKAFTPKGDPGKGILLSTFSHGEQGERIETAGSSRGCPLGRRGGFEMEEGKEEDRVRRGWLPGPGWCTGGGPGWKDGFCGDRREAS